MIRLISLFIPILRLNKRDKFFLITAGASIDKNLSTKLLTLKKGYQSKESIWNILTPPNLVILRDIQLGSKRRSLTKY